MAKSLKQSMNQVFDIHGIVRDLNILTSSDTHPRERLRVGLKLAFNIGLDALNFVDFGEGSLIDDGIHVADDLWNGMEDFCSFTPATKVATNHGEQPIGTLHVGEQVLAYNPQTHKMEYEPILHVWIHKI
jgi:hypothetical protein